MIKINLLRNRASATASSMSSRSLGETPEKLALKNLGLLMIPTVLIFLYEYQNISGLQSELNKTVGSENALYTEVEQKKTYAEEAKKLSEQLNQVKERLQIIRNLSKNRFAELKTLDLLQSIIPDRVWLEGISFVNNKFDITAIAVEIEDVTLMKTAMDNQDSFKNVNIRNTVEKTIKENTVHSFNMTFEIEDVN